VETGYEVGPELLISGVEEVGFGVSCFDLSVVLREESIYWEVHSVLISYIF
jgi:hypothetical protein